MVSVCRYGFKIVAWKTSGRDLRWLGHTIQPYTRTCWTRRQQRHSTLTTRLTFSRHQQLGTDHHRLFCLPHSLATTPVWGCRELPPPTAHNHSPTSISLPSLPASISHSSALLLPDRQPDHRLLFHTPPPVKVAVKVTGSPDYAHAPLAVQWFPVCSSFRQAVPRRLACSSHTSATLSDRHKNFNADNDFAQFTLGTLHDSKQLTFIIGYTLLIYVL